MQLAKIVSSVLPSVTGAMTAAVVGFLLNTSFHPPDLPRPSSPQGPTPIAAESQPSRKPIHEQRPTCPQPVSPRLSLSLVGTVQVFGATISAAIWVAPASSEHRPPVELSQTLVHEVARAHAALALGSARQVKRARSTRLAARAMPAKWMGAAPVPAALRDDGSYGGLGSSPEPATPSTRIHAVSVAEGVGWSGVSRVAATSARSGM